MLPIPDIQTTEYRATQLVYSIKFKLSHAISLLNEDKFVFDDIAARNVII